MSSEKVVAFTDANFDHEVIQSDIPVLVDFWATWCAPCKAISPLVDTVADEYAGKVKVGKVNVDENQATPGKYGVRGIPTIILFKGGSRHRPDRRGGPQVATGRPDRQGAVSYHETYQTCPSACHGSCPGRTHGAFTGPGFSVAPQRAAGSCIQGGHHVRAAGIHGQLSGPCAGG